MGRTQLSSGSCEAPREYPLRSTQLWVAACTLCRPSFWRAGHSVPSCWELPSVRGRVAESLRPSPVFWATRAELFLRVTAAPCSPCTRAPEPGAYFGRAAIHACRPCSEPRHGVAGPLRREPSVCWAWPCALPQPCPVVPLVHFRTQCPLRAPGPHLIREPLQASPCGSARLGLSTGVLCLVPRGASWAGRHGAGQGSWPRTAPTPDCTRGTACAAEPALCMCVTVTCLLLVAGTGFEK